MTSKLTIGVDFNGVIHDHRDGARGFAEAGSPEIPGAIDWLRAISEEFAVVLVSASFARSPSVHAARSWLESKGIPRAWTSPVLVGMPRIAMSPFKPACVMFIDDRAFHFCGQFPTVDEIRSFKPWNR